MALTQLSAQTRLERRFISKIDNENSVVPLQGFDKASNSLFLPPEFFSVNCSTCISIITGASLDQVSPAHDPFVGQNVTFRTSFALGSRCGWLVTLDIPGGQSVLWYPLPYIIDLDFGDGSSTTSGTSGGSAISPPPPAYESHSYTSAATYGTDAIMACSCNILFSLWFASEDVTVKVPTPLKIRLTFDDGPTSAASNNNTLDVINALKSNPVVDDIPATFFVQTHVSNRGAHPNGVANMELALQHDHNIMIHTGSTEDHKEHTIRVALPPYNGGTNALESDLIRAKQRIAGLQGGSVPGLVRAPYGLTNSAVLATYALQSLEHKHWDVDTTDSTPGSNFASISAALVAGLVSEISAGNTDITILFHDIHSKTADNLATPAVGYLSLIESTLALAGFVPQFEKL